ncbi:EF hand [Mariprofundus ferrinatatus]|uniref:EF hand n=1 Tax=Mariprofundus ferrinatatus TaxID=1921087 RepID=A0A2K8L3V1_9PROT|nr:EF-hand domain-containing protein [Mariprofundus ferrinatatus]ATX80909.1 EF hand [Mariprofundus ferrinatatus]
MRLATFYTAPLLALLLVSTPALADENSSAFDANGDGQITFEEVMQRLETSARATFDAMDRNKDGVISDKDFDDVREGMEKLERWFEDLLKPFLPEQEETGHLET